MRRKEPRAIREEEGGRKEGGRRGQEKSRGKRGCNRVQQKIFSARSSGRRREKEHGRAWGLEEEVEAMGKKHSTMFDSEIA